MRFNPTIIDNQVPHRDPRRHAAPMQPEEKGRVSAAFLRSYMEALIGDLEHLGERLHLGNQSERERHTQTLRHVTPPPIKPNKCLATVTKNTQTIGHES